MSEEFLRTLESRVDAVVRECRDLRSSNATLRSTDEDRRAAGLAARKRVEETLRDVRSVLGSAVRILRED